MEPKSVNRLSDGLEIIWDNDVSCVYPYKYLRLQCACALCVEELTGKKLLKVDEVPEDIIIVEKSEKALKHAMELGGDHGVLIDGNEVEKVKELTKGKGAEAVIDFVGEKGSTSMGLNMTSNGGYFYIVGYGEEIKILDVDVIIS